MERPSNHKVSAQGMTQERGGPARKTSHVTRSLGLWTTWYQSDLQGVEEAGDWVQSQISHVCVIQPASKLWTGSSSQIPCLTVVFFWARSHLDTKRMIEGSAALITLLPCNPRTLHPPYFDRTIFYYIFPPGGFSFALFSAESPEPGTGPWMDGLMNEWLLGSWINMSRAPMRPKMETRLCVTWI